jgi:hypothetical protein
MTTITKVQALPFSPYNDTGVAGIFITSGIPSYFRVTGAGLSHIVSVHWYPKNPSSVQFATRQMILVSDSEGTFMIQVTDNYLNITDRAGYLSFRLDDGSTIAYPVKTYGPVSAGPLWQAPDQGLITG